MAITTDKNTQYGPPLVNQKYAPLLDPQFTNVDQAVYTALITNRAANLRAANRLGRPLTLATNTWDKAVKAEATHLPPLVVISSNRSGWIAGGIVAAQKQLNHLGLRKFANASDLRALEANADQGQSPPIYAPTRIGGNRNVYIVVHLLEYNTYKTALAGTGIRIVGYRFDESGGGPQGVSLVGFGASRFAAMEFCKVLRRLAAAAAGGNAPWDYAWLVDDNVVALSNFAGLAAAEAALQANEVCVGIHGGTSAETFLTNRTWARAEVAEGRGRQAGALPADEPPGIVQQMSLWNVNYLDTNYLNFGPIYITSAEDLSITNYFNSQNIPYRYYKGIGVRKEDTVYDNGPAATLLNNARKAIAGFTTRCEARAGQPPAPPPPTMIQPVNADDGGVQNLTNFIVNRVLPNAAPLREQAGNANVQNTAKCQAVEQIVCGAIDEGFVAVAGYNASFKINGAQAQVVNRRDI
jgi:hypothetical protein